MNDEEQNQLADFIEGLERTGLADHASIQLTQKNTGHTVTMTLGQLREEFNRHKIY